MKRLINSIDLILSLCSLFMAAAIYNPAKISSFTRIQRCQRREQQSPTPLNARSVSPPSWYCQPLSQVPHQISSSASYYHFLIFLLYFREVARSFRGGYCLRSWCSAPLCQHCLSSAWAAGVLRTPPLRRKTRQLAIHSGGEKGHGYGEDGIRQGFPDPLPSKSALSLTFLCLCFSWSSRRRILPMLKTI